MDFVVPDQFLDRTNQGRKQTFFEEGLVAHIGFAQPIHRALELLGGRQTGFALAAPGSTARGGQTRTSRTQRPARPHAPTPEELEAHDALLKKLKSPLWLAP